MGRAFLYIRKGEDERSWEMLLAWCRRENIGVSEWVMERVREFVTIHCAGNNQTMLDYAEKPKCLPEWKTCRESNGRLDRGLFKCSKHGLMGPKRCEKLAHHVVNKMDVGCYRLKESSRLSSTGKEGMKNEI